VTQTTSYTAGPFLRFTYNKTKPAASAAGFVVVNYVMILFTVDEMRGGPEK
jgi:hypothetical protein